MEIKKINWGILGCALIAQEHLIPGLLEASNACLYGIASRGDSTRLHKFVNDYNPVKSYTSYEDLLNDPQIDAVYIPLPNKLHCEWVKKAAAHKKHVLCEKPLGINAAEVQDMQSACDENGVLLMEAFAYRHSPLTQSVKLIVDSGRIGDVKFIDAHFSYQLDDYDNVRLKADLSGGATYDIGCYNLSVIRYILGQEPLSILATGEIGAHSQVDESGCVILTFANGVSAFSFCSLHATDRSEYTIVGTKGLIHVPVRFNFKGQAPLIIRNGEQSETLTIDCPDNYKLEIEQFGRCIRGDETPYVDFASSLGNAQVIDQILTQIHL